MSTIAVQLRHAEPTTRPSRRAPRHSQRRGPQAHPQRLTQPGLTQPGLTHSGLAHSGLAQSGTGSFSSGGAQAVRACAVAAAPTTTGWSLTERGYALMVSALGAAALFLIVMLVTTFLSISNAPLG